MSLESTLAGMSVSARIGGGKKNMGDIFMHMEAVKKLFVSREGGEVKSLGGGCEKGPPYLCVLFVVPGGSHIV